MYIINTTELWQYGYCYVSYEPTIQPIDAAESAIFSDNSGGFRIVKLSKKQ